MDQRWRPVDHPAPQPYALRPYVPPGPAAETWRDIGDPIDWIVLAVLLTPLLIGVVWALGVVLTRR